MLAISQTHISFIFNPQDSRPRTCQPPGKQVSQSSCKHEKKWMERNPRALRSSIVKVTSHCGEIGSTKLHHSFRHVLSSCIKTQPSSSEAPIIHEACTESRFAALGKQPLLFNWLPSLHACITDSFATTSRCWTFPGQMSSMASSPTIGKTAKPLRQPH